MLFLAKQKKREGIILLIMISNKSKKLKQKKLNTLNIKVIMTTSKN